MKIEDFKIILNSNRINLKASTTYWNERSIEFHDFWENKILNDNYELIEYDDIDPIVRIIDPNGKRSYLNGINFSGIEAVGSVMIPQTQHRILYSVVKNDKTFKYKLDEVFKADERNEQNELSLLINQLNKIDNNRTWLIKKAACYLNALLFLHNPKDNSRITSLNDRFKLIEFLECNEINYTSLTMGEKIVYTKSKINEICKDLNIPVGAISKYIYSQQISKLWKGTKILSKKKKIDQHEDIYENLIQVSDNDFESAIDELSSKGDIVEKMKLVKIRKLYYKVINQLKLLYNHTCQICSNSSPQNFNYNICEAHHINYFSKSKDNSSKNIMILCPNHHRLIHKSNAVFDRINLLYKLSNGIELKITLDKHLGEKS